MKTRADRRTIHLDLSGVDSEGTRRLVRAIARELGVENARAAWKSFWRLLAEASGSESRHRCVVVADLARCVAGFRKAGAARWIATIRSVRPSIVAVADEPGARASAAAIDDVVLASEGRLVIRSLSGRAARRSAIAHAIAATAPESLVAVRTAEDALWLEFGDGFGFSLAWNDVPLPEGTVLRRETARVSSDLASLQFSDASGRTVDVDALALRSLRDDRTAARIRGEARESATSLGALLRHKRRDAHVTQQELQSRAGLDQSLISRLEAGLHQPRFDTLARYAKGLGLSVPQLLSPARG